MPFSSVCATSMVNGKQFEIVVPLYSELMARGAGENVKGIFGSQNWDWKLENQLGSRYIGTNAFVQLVR